MQKNAKFLHEIAKYQINFFFLHSQDYAISILIELNKHIVITLNLLIGYYLAKRIFLTNQQLKKNLFQKPVIGNQECRNLYM
jgi:uncharacterized protein YneF (UPF0154 family)